MTPTDFLTPLPSSTQLDRGAGRVRLLMDPDDSVECVRGLDAAHDLDQGVVVCHLSPGVGTRSVLAEDLLLALGKLPVAISHEQPARGGWDLARLWMGAERVRHLVVLRAHLLAAPLWHDLAELAADEQMVVWLVCHQHGVNPEHGAALGAQGGPVVSARQPWRGVLPALTQRKHVGGGVTRFPAVPDVGFPVFRAVAARLLEPAEFARVDEVYRATMRAARAEARTWQTLGRGRDQPGGQVVTGAVLQRLTVAATTPDDVTTRVRAAEAGFFREGTLLQLRPTFGLLTGRAASMTTLVPRSSPEVVARLRTLRSPGPAALLAIALATGMSPAQLARPRMNDFTETDGGGLEFTTYGERYRLPGPFAAAVRAALTERRHTPGRQAGDTLFTERGSRPTATTRALSKVVAQAGVTPPRPIGNVVLHNLRLTGCPS